MCVGRFVECLVWVLGCKFRFVRGLGEGGPHVPSNLKKRKVSSPKAVETIFGGPTGLWGLGSEVPGSLWALGSDVPGAPGA